jgi:hypothetical protein
MFLVLPKVSSDNPALGTHPAGGAGKPWLHGVQTRYYCSITFDCHVTFDGAKPDDLFEWLVERIGYP